MKERVVAIVPARYGSSRLPGKPLAEIAGKPMVVRVLERAAEIGIVEQVVAATDHQGIVETVEAAGFRCVMTDPAHPSGTDRIAEAARVLGLPEEAVVVNIQGDQPLVEPEPVEKMVELLLSGGFHMTTCATPMPAWEVSNPNRVKVVLGKDGRAIYFSRSPIPFDRDGLMEKRGASYLRHLGLYAYRNGFLQEFVSLPPGELEAVEQLEQLRALENGYTIGVALVESAPPEVDTKDDLETVEEFLLRR